MVGEPTLVAAQRLSERKRKRQANKPTFVSANAASPPCKPAYMRANSRSQASGCGHSRANAGVHGRKRAQTGERVRARASA